MPILVTFVSARQLPKCSVAYKIQMTELLSANKVPSLVTVTAIYKGLSRPMFTFAPILYKVYCDIVHLTCLSQRGASSVYIRTWQRCYTEPVRVCRPSTYCHRFRRCVIVCEHIHLCHSLSPMGYVSRSFAQPECKLGAERFTL